MSPETLQAFLDAPKTGTAAFLAGWFAGLVVAYMFARVITR